MVACFEKMDEEVNGSADGSGSAVSARTKGSTAVVMLVAKEVLVVANCGDSRAVLCHGGIAVPLSRDHKSPYKSSSLRCIGVPVIRQRCLEYSRRPISVAAAALLSTIWASSKQILHHPAADAASAAAAAAAPYRSTADAHI
ncbi:hypothetical protein F0562_011618 [Nyssa sinensis]|uniref:PPM-type phosphatase domain-containing protein n=1 Tax=Nyssa sinensis TaxID=561372 RepID=A0A5J4ZQG9_9ASTE|nr:hypothetical protein F0562_011618 [Nyssa sinensis]